MGAGTKATTRRKELKFARAYLQGGFNGTSAINDSTLAASDTTFGVDTHSLFDSTKIVPIGARFTFTAEPTVIRCCTATQNSQQFSLDMTAPTAGTFTVTINGNTSAAIAYDVAAAAFQTALEAITGVGSGQVTVTESSDVYTITFAGTLKNISTNTLTVDGSGLTASNSHVLTTAQDGTTTWEVTFDTGLTAGSLPSDDDVLTWYPPRIEIDIPDDGGSVEWTESEEVIVDTVRQSISGTRAGPEQALTFSASLLFEFLRASSGQELKPYEAIRKLGDAANWQISRYARSTCEKYAIDFVIVDAPDCGSELAEGIIFKQVTFTELNPTFTDGVINLSGTSPFFLPKTERIANTDFAKATFV